jgi:hypothetical protein
MISNGNNWTDVASRQSPVARIKAGRDDAEVIRTGTGMILAPSGSAGSNAVDKVARSDARKRRSFIVVAGVGSVGGALFCFLSSVVLDLLEWF